MFSDPAREAAAYDRAVERELGAGYALFELCQDEDVALTDAWDGNDDELKVEPGRIGVESAAKNHNPLIELSSYTNEPGPVADGYELFGQVEVEWETDHVELWTSDSDIGRAPQLTLPPSPSGTYHLRVARAFAAEVQGSLKDYLWDNQDVDNHGLERWRFDFWPMSRVLRTTDALRARTQAIGLAPQPALVHRLKSSGARHAK